MGRSLKKGPYVNERLLAKVEKQQRNNSREPIIVVSESITAVQNDGLKRYSG